MPNQVVLLTPAGRGAVASLSIEGPQATSLVDRQFQAAAGKPLAELAVGRIWYGRWGSSSSSAAAEDVVVCRRTEERVDVNCHGGQAAAQAIVNSLISDDCREVAWQEWVKDSTADSITTAAHVALASAPTARMAAILLDQHAGALRRTMNNAVKSLAAGDEAIGAEILEQLLKRSHLGRHLCEPWKVIFAGPPNVGKSSLINAVLGYQRSIVFDQPGTTRDVVTAVTAIDGWPVELADSAGLRSSTDEIEQAGIELAQRQLSQADLIVLIFDASEPFTSKHEKMWEQFTDSLVVFNKSDLAEGQPPPAGIATSATTGAGVDQLIERIGRFLVPQAPPAGMGIPFHEEQVTAIRAAHQAASRGDSTAAIATLEQL